MALTNAHAPGATPLRAEEIKGLKHAVTTHGELNELEAANILDAQEWALRARRTKMPEMLSDEYMLVLHRKMYGDVWKWAGQFRLHDTNIGVPHTRIRTELRTMYDDARFWIERETYTAEELVIRLHHRLVWVHPFANGNGRQARLIADLVLVRHFKRERLRWGGNSLGSVDPRRADYITALRAADARDYVPLVEFCRS
jgi:Fic-DOC domain mobile mystery protein B